MNPDADPAGTCPHPPGQHRPIRRTVRFAGRTWNSYQVMLLLGLHVGVLSSTVLAVQSGHRPLTYALCAALVCVAAVAGCRFFHLARQAIRLRRGIRWRDLVDGSRSGGAALYGSLLGLVPASFVAAWAQGISPGRLMDMYALGILAGGCWARMGCVLNGCCGGRETQSWMGLWLYDVRDVWKRRIPVQHLEMAWWLLGTGVFCLLWPRQHPVGSYALGMLCWYSTGRFVLEWWREQPDRVRGGLPLHAIISAGLALGAGAALVVRLGL